MFIPYDHLLIEHQYDGTTWQDITGGLVSVALTLREFSGAHTAAISLYDDSIDPAQSTGTTVLKEGDKVRAWAQNPAGGLRKMATFTIRRVVTDIDLSKPPGRTHRVSLTLKGTGITGVGGSGASSGTTSLTELSNVITGAGFEINGDGHGTGVIAPTGTLTEAAVINEASELDQILLTRDSNPGTVAFEDPDGKIQIFDSDTYRTAAPTWTIGPGNYSAINMRGVDTSHVINVLTIRYVEKFKTGSGATRKVELDQTFKDLPSVAKYGPHKHKVTIHHQTDFAAYADKVFAKNADPAPVPTSVVIPIRAAAELLPGYDENAYVGNKVTIVAPDGVTAYTCRVARISHQIVQRKWLVQIDLRNASVIQRPRTPAAAVDTETANNPDGTVQTVHLDDGAVDGAKLSDDIDGTGKTVTGAHLTTGGVPSVSLLQQAGVGQLLFALATENNDGQITAQGDAGSSQLILKSPTPAAGVIAAQLALLTDTLAGPRIQIVGCGLIVDDGLNVTGPATLNDGLTVTNGYSLGGGGSINGPISNNGGGITSGGDVTGARLFSTNPGTTTNAANIRLPASGGGDIKIATSLSKYKLKQEPLSLEAVRGLLDLTPKTWFDRGEFYDNGRTTDGLRRIPGVVAEDVHEHAPAFASYDEAGDLQGVAYDRIAAGLIPIIRDQAETIARLEQRLEALEKGTAR